MKQKYVILENDNDLIVQEFAELDKELMSLICEQAYDADTIKKAIEEGVDSVISCITTKNMYPPQIYMTKIAEAVIQFYTKEDREPVNVFFDDIQLLIQNREELEKEEAVDDNADIDDLLNDDDEAIDDDLGEDTTLDTINSNSSIKIADDETLDTDGV